MKVISDRVKNIKKVREPTMRDLKAELNLVKVELQELKERVVIFELLHKEQNQLDFKRPEKDLSNGEEINSINNLHYVNLVDRVITYKWHTKIIVVVHKEYLFNTISCRFELHKGRVGAIKIFFQEYGKATHCR